MLTSSLSPLVNLEFQLESALALGEASALAYLDREGVEAAYGSTPQIQMIDCFDIDDTQGFVLSTADVVVLAFRGTELNFSDWLRNLKVLRTKHALGPVHSGFASGLDKIWPSLPDLCRKHSFEGKRFWLTGHSLGAALATLAAARFYEAGSAIAGLYTFGQPRLATEAFQIGFDAQFSGRMFRFVNQSDIVPRIPPGYRHVRTAKRITGSGDLEYASGAFDPGHDSKGEPPGAVLETDLDPLREDQFDLLVEYVAELPPIQVSARADTSEFASKEGVLPWIADHAISEYVARIRELITKRGAQHD